MTKLFNLLNQVRKDEEGPTMVEYAIMVSLIAVISIVVVGYLGSNVSSIFSTVCHDLNAGGTC